MIALIGTPNSRRQGIAWTILKSRVVLPGTKDVAEIENGNVASPLLRCRETEPLLTFGRPDPVFELEARF